MLKLDDFKEALSYLNRGQSLYLKDMTLVIKKANSFILNNKGNRYSLKEEDFTLLYQKEDFYFKEDEDVFIDDNKDAEYYAFKHK